jgi:hypothetical protein
MIGAISFAVLAARSRCELVLETAWRSEVCTAQPDTVAIFDNESSEGTLLYQFFWENYGYAPGYCGYNPLYVTSYGCCSESLDISYSDYYLSARYEPYPEMPLDPPVDIINGNYCHITALDDGSFYELLELYLKPSADCNKNMICSDSNLFVFADSDCSGAAENYQFVEDNSDLTSEILGRVSINFVNISSGPDYKRYGWKQFMPASLQTPKFDNPFQLLCFIVGCLAIFYALYKVVKSSITAYHTPKKPYSIPHLVIDGGWFIRSVLNMTTWSIATSTDLEWQIQENISESLFNICTLITVWESIVHLMEFNYVHNLNIWRGVVVGLAVLHLVLSGSRYFVILEYGILGVDLQYFVLDWGYLPPFWIVFVLAVDLAVPSFLFYMMLSINAQNNQSVLANFLFIAQKHKKFVAFLVLQLLNTIVIIFHMAVLTYTEILANDLNYNASFYGLSCLFQVIHSDLNSLLMSELRIVFKKSGKFLKASGIKLKQKAVHPLVAKTVPANSAPAASKVFGEVDPTFKL